MENPKQTQLLLFSTLICLFFYLSKARKMSEPTLILGGSMYFLVICWYGIAVVVMDIVVMYNTFFLQKKKDTRTTIVSLSLAHSLTL